MLCVRIAALRRRFGWSQAELAQKLKISPSAVGMYEQGRREPSADTIVALSEVFEVSTDYLLTGKQMHAQDCQAAQQAFCSCMSSAQALLSSRRSPPFSSQELAVLFSAMLQDS